VDAFDINALVDQRAQCDKMYLEFLRVPSMSMGLYLIPAGGNDPQQPHSEDEVYYVVQGRGTIRVGDEDRAVGPGSVVYVPALLTHRFHTITEGLRVLVFFAPPEYSQSS